MLASIPRFRTFLASKWHFAAMSLLPGLFGPGAIQAQLNFEWRHTLAAPSFGAAIARGNDASLYITGSLTLHSSDSQIFVAKFDGDGFLQWLRIAAARRVEPFIHASGTDIGIDEAGNVYVTGLFWGDTDLDGDGHLDLATAREDLEVFVAKLHPDGDVLWARHLSNTEASATDVPALAVDRAGNSYVIANYRDGADFDEDGTDDMTCHRFDLCVLVARYDRNGNFLGANGTRSGHASSGGISTDASRNIYITGSLNGRVNFNSGREPRVVGVDFRSSYFVAKYSRLGNLAWIRAVTAPNSNLFYTGHAIAVRDDEVYVTGQFDVIETSFPSHNLFLARYDGAGRLRWSSTASGTGGIAGRGLALGPNGAVYITGDYTLDADFDGDGIDDVPPTPGHGSPRLFLARYGANGVLGDVGALSSFSQGRDVGIGKTNGVFVTGRFAFAGIVKYTDHFVMRLNGLHPGETLPTVR